MNDQIHFKKLADKIHDRYDPNHDIDPCHVDDRFSPISTTEVQLLALTEYLLDMVESLAARVWVLEHPANPIVTPHKPSPTHQQAIYTINAAVEGGIGYWSLVSNYDCDKGIVSVHEIEDGGLTVLSTTHITPELLIEKSDEFIAYTNEKLNVNEHDYLDWDDYDSEMADCFIQFICFGEVRYG